MIDFECPHCDQRYRFEDHYAGRSGRCKKCGEQFQVNEPAASSVSEPATPTRFEADQKNDAYTTETYELDPPPLPTSHFGQYKPANESYLTGHNAKETGESSDFDVIYLAGAGLGLTAFVAIAFVEIILSVPWWGLDSSNVRPMTYFVMPTLWAGIHLLLFLAMRCGVRGGFPFTWHIGRWCAVLPACWFVALVLSNVILNLYDPFNESDGPRLWYAACALFAAVGFAVWLLNPPSHESSESITGQSLGRRAALIVVLMASWAGISALAAEEPASTQTVTERDATGEETQQASTTSDEQSQGHQATTQQDPDGDVQEATGVPARASATDSVSFSMTLNDRTVDSSTSPPTRADAQRFVDRLEQGGIDGLEKNLDLEAFTERIDFPSSIAIDTKTRKEIIRERVLTQGYNFNEFARSNHGWHLKATKRDGHYRKAMVRVIEDTGSFTFVEFVLEDDPVRAVDWTEVSSSKLASEVVKKSLTRGFNFGQRRRNGNLTAEDKAWWKAVKAEKTVKTLIRQGEGRAVLDWFEKLPPSLKSDRIFFWPLAFSAAAATSSKAYSRVLSQYQSHFGSGPDVAIFRVRAHMGSGGTAETCAEAVKDLERRVGKDAYLRSMVGLRFAREGKFKRARREMNLALKLEPSLPDVWRTSLVLAAQADDHQIAIEALRKLKAIPDTQMPNLEGDPLFADLLESSAYRRWKGEDVGASLGNP